MVVAPPPAVTVGHATRKVRRLDRTRIATAVIEVGFDALTTIEVAKHLGVAQGSLYRHITSRDDLVVLGLERIVGELEWPALRQDWQSFLRAEANTLWALLEQHPGLANEMSILESTPSALKLRQQAVVDHLVDAGMTPLNADLAADTVIDLVLDVHIRTAVIATMHDPIVTGHQWFAAKLDIVVAGIEALLCPGTGDIPLHDA